MERAPEPTMGTERELLLGWLAFHRDALAANCEGVSPEDLVRTGLGGSTMSLLGLVRHLTEMERSYLVTAIGGGQLVTLYGPYEDGRPEGDFDGLTPALVEPSFAAWYAERAHSDRLIEQHPSLDDTGPDSDRSVRAGLLMVIQEYARHNGHADLMRQSIDGARGE